MNKIADNNNELLICKYCYNCNYYFITSYNFCLFCNTNLKFYNLKKFFIYHKFYNSIINYTILTLYNFKTYYYNYFVKKIIKCVNKHIDITDSSDLIWIIIGALVLKNKRFSLNLIYNNDYYDSYMLSLDFFMSLTFFTDYEVKFKNWKKQVHNNDPMFKYYYNYYLKKMNYNIYLDYDLMKYTMENFLNIIKY
jgi:hypothetical protein